MNIMKRLHLFIYMATFFLLSHWFSLSKDLRFLSSWSVQSVMVTLALQKWIIRQKIHKIFVTNSEGLTVMPHTVT